MRAEAVNDEAMNYSGDGDVYLHLERVNGGALWGVFNATPETLLQAIAELLVLLERTSGLSRYTILWDLHKLMRGVKKKSVFINNSEGDDE